MLALRHRWLFAGLLALARSLSARDPNATDPVIAEARKVAACLSSLSSASGANPSACPGQTVPWQIVDIVGTDTVADHGNEVDMSIRLHGAPGTEKQADSTGSWAEGDFSGVVQAILSPASNALFTKKRAVTIAKRRAWRYDYSVDQTHSDWQLSYLSAGRKLTWEPAFGGTIWIDQGTSRVLRFEMAARNLPESFPFAKVEWTIDYDFVKINGENYLLPKHSEATSCPRSIPKCTRNITEFQNYKAYGADSSISFDDGK